MAAESPCVSQIKAIGARLDALEKMDDEREDRNKERFVAMREAVASALASADKALVKAETALTKTLMEQRRLAIAASPGFTTQQIPNRRLCGGWPG